MMSTHVAYGFVSGYLIALLFAPSMYLSYPMVMPATVAFVIVGMFGGALPDVDQLESMGFVHKKTCHYILGYLAAAVILIGAAPLVSEYQVWMLTFACISLAAWLHSIMDLFDGWRDDDPTQGIYEHLSRRWLPSFRLVMFAGLREWIILALAFVFFIPISAKISQLFPLGWQVATIAGAVVWIVSAVFDAFYRAPRRQPRERLQLEKLKATKTRESTQAI